MEWFESDTRMQFAETARRFAQRELSARQDQSGQPLPEAIPWGALRGAAAAGLLSGTLPEELGGIGLDTVSTVILWDRLAAGLAGPAALMAFHAAGLSLLAELRDVSSVRAWLATVCVTGQDHPALLGLVLPEPVVGSAAPTVPRIEWGCAGEVASLHGSFLCLPGLPAATRLVVMVPAGEGGSAILWSEARGLERLVSAGFPGTGLEELPSSRLALSGRLPEGMEVLCSGGRARDLYDLTLARVRVALAAVQTGNAGAAWQEALEYSRQRVQTGRIICEHQEVRRMLTEMECRVQACRSLAYRAAALLDGDGGVGRASSLAAQAHGFCDGEAEKVCLDAVQVLGGYGYMKDYGVEKRLRDCKSLQGILGSYVADWLGEE